MLLPFAKWHTLGNDFLILDGRIFSLPWDRYAPFLAHRNFGLGCDQVLVAMNSQRAHVRMLIYNQDGSEAEMCGNGIRAFAAHILRDEGEGTTSLTIETASGIYEVKQKGENYRVAMDAPRFTLEAIGADLGTFAATSAHKFPLLSLPHWPEPIRKAQIVPVSVGNPHLVVFLNSLEGLPLEEWGPLLEKDPAFPNRINVEFVEVLSPTRIRGRVWERGAGATWACGTGATAAAVAGIVTGQCTSPVTVELPGGTLTVEWDNGGMAFLEGPVTFVAEGFIHLKAFERWERIGRGV